MKNARIYILLLILTLLMLGCVNNTSPQKAITIPHKLVIGVVGDIPKIRESNVEFRSLSLEQLNSDLDKDIHALFIMREHHQNAAASNYYNFYTHYDRPILFINSEKSLPVYTNPEIPYTESPSSKDGMYTQGIFHLGRSDEQQFAFGLYNDVKSPENILAMYTEVLKKILDLGVLYKS